MVTSNCLPESSPVYGCEWALRRSQKQPSRIDRARSGGRISQRRAHSRGSLRGTNCDNQKLSAQEAKSRHVSEHLSRDAEQLCFPPTSGVDSLDLSSTLNVPNIDSLTVTTKALDGEDVKAAAIMPVHNKLSSTVAQHVGTPQFDALESPSGICVGKLISKLIEDAVEIDTDADVDVLCSEDEEWICCTFDEKDGAIGSLAAKPSTTEEQSLLEFGEANFDVVGLSTLVDVCEHEVDFSVESESEGVDVDLSERLKELICFEKVCTFSDDDIVDDFEWFEEDEDVQAPAMQAEVIRMAQIAKQALEARIREEEALRLRAIILKQIQVKAAEDRVAEALKQEEAVARRKAEEQMASRQRIRDKDAEDMARRRAAEAARRDTMLGEDERRDRADERPLSERTPTEKILRTESTKAPCAPTWRAHEDGLSHTFEEKAARSQSQDEVDITGQSAAKLPAKETAVGVRESATKAKEDAAKRAAKEDAGRARAALAARRAQKAAERKKVEQLEMARAAEEAARSAKEAAEKMAAEDEAAGLIAQRMAEKKAAKEDKRRKSAKADVARIQAAQANALKEEVALAQIQGGPDEDVARPDGEGLVKLDSADAGVFGGQEEVRASSAGNAASERINSQSTSSLQGDRCARTRRRIIGRVVREPAPFQKDPHKKVGSSVLLGDVPCTPIKSKERGLRPVQVFSMDMDAESSSCEVRESSLVRGYDALDVQFFSIQDDDCPQGSAQCCDHYGNAVRPSSGKCLSRSNSKSGLPSALKMDLGFDAPMVSRLASISAAEHRISSLPDDRVLSRPSPAATPSRPTSACRGMLKSSSAPLRATTTMTCTNKSAMVTSLFSSYQAAQGKRGFAATMKRTVEMARSASRYHLPEPCY